MLGLFLLSLPYAGIFENIFGFIPSAISLSRLYTFFTYSFMHANIWILLPVFQMHLIPNILMLLIVGLILEDKLGAKYYISIYFFSGVVAVVFDLIGRFVFNITLDAPFIGASGPLFGLAILAVMINPNERIPTVLSFLSIVIFIILPLAIVINNYKLVVFLENPFIFLSFLLLIGLIFGTYVSVSPYFPAILSLYTIFYILLIIAELTSGMPMGVSHLGHFGGFIGGIIAFFVLAEKIKQA